MSGRIGRAFTRAAREGRAALVVFVEAGDPSLEVTERLLPALAAAGEGLVGRVCLRGRHGVGSARCVAEDAACKRIR